MADDPNQVVVLTMVPTTHLADEVILRERLLSSREDRKAGEPRGGWIRCSPKPCPASRQMDE